MTKETSGDGATTQKMYFKGDKMRMDHGDGDYGDYMVWDTAEKEGFRVDAEKQIVVIMPWRDVKPEGTKKLFEGMTVTKTGKSDKVAGYVCDMYLSKDRDDNSTSEFCVTKGISNAAIFGFMSGDVTGGGYPAWFREIVKDGGSPSGQSIGMNPAKKNPVLSPPSRPRNSTMACSPYRRDSKPWIERR